MPPFPESPRCLSPFQGNLFSLHCLDFQAEHRHRHTQRWHVGQPFGKASRERHRFLDPWEEKRDTAATGREESARACPLSRRGLTPLGRLQKYPKFHVSTGRNPQVPAPTPHKVLGPGFDGRGIPRGPRGTPGHATIPRVPQMSQSIPGKPVSLDCRDFKAEDRLTPRWHVGQPCGKASWESLEGSLRSLDPR